MVLSSILSVPGNLGSGARHCAFHLIGAGQFHILIFSVLLRRDSLTPLGLAILLGVGKSTPPLVPCELGGRPAWPLEGHWAGPWVIWMHSL